MSSPSPPFEHNRAAWNQLVEAGNVWTQPVDGDVIARARSGDWSVVLTPTKPVPADWFPPLAGAEVLGLASGGGQQMPIFAAAGARATTLDLSDRQLEQDRTVAAREGLMIETVQGRMDDLSMFDDGRFDLVFHPCSNVFAPDVRPVWKEAARVLKPGGTLLAGFVNPIVHAADEAEAEAGRIRLIHSIPYADANHPDVVERRKAEGSPLEHGHPLDHQIGGQLRAGLVLTGFYEDVWPGDDKYERAFNAVMPAFIATRSVRPAS